MLRAMQVALMGMAMSVGSAAPVWAVVQVSNLSNANDFNYTMKSTTDRIAGSFTTDASAASWTLAGVTARLQGNGSSPVQMSLFDNVGGQPGSLLEVLAGTPAPAVSNTDYSFTSAGEALSPSTTYWLVYQMLSGSPSVYWAGTNNLSQTSPNAWTIGNGIAGSSNSGTTWGSGSGAVQFRVDTAAAALDISPPFVTAPAPFVASQGDVVTLAAIYGDSQDPNPSISWVTPFGNFTGNNIPMTIPLNAPLGTYPPAGIPITVIITDASENSTSAQTSFTVTAAEAVPEPSTFVLAALGLLGLGCVALRKKYRRA